MVEFQDETAVGCQVAAVIAAFAEAEVLVEAADHRRLRGASVAYKRAEVAASYDVGGVHILVARQTQPRFVAFAVDHRPHRPATLAHLRSHYRSLSQSIIDKINNLSAENKHKLSSMTMHETQIQQQRFSTSLGIVITEFELN